MFRFMRRIRMAASLYSDNAYRENRRYWGWISLATCWDVAGIFHGESR